MPNFLRRQDTPYVDNSKSNNNNAVNGTMAYLGVTEAPWLNRTCVERLDRPDGAREGYTWLHKLPQFLSYTTVSPVLCYNESYDGNVSWGQGTTTKATPGYSIADNEDVRVGVLFASKAVVQLLANPFMGPLTNR